jgi:hypothetical protein
MTERPTQASCFGDDGQTKSSAFFCKQSILFRKRTPHAHDTARSTPRASRDSELSSSLDRTAPTFRTTRLILIEPTNAQTLSPACHRTSTCGHWPLWCCAQVPKSRRRRKRCGANCREPSAAMVGWRSRRCVALGESFVTYHQGFRVDRVAASRQYASKRYDNATTH